MSRRRLGRFVAHALVRARADGPALRIAAAAIRRGSRGRRIAQWLGWHLGENAGSTPRIARLRSGSRMLVDVRDYAHRHILLNGTYEDDLSALFARLARPGWTVLDVGANAGYFSLLAADLGGSASRIVAFEPQRPLAALMRRTLALQPDAPIELVEAACGDHDGVARLASPDDPRNTGLATLAAGRSSDEGIEVELVRLDRFCAAHDLLPDLVKIDVEGAEQRVLCGMDELLSRGVPRCVVCEVWCETRAAVIDYMQAHGYRARAIGQDGSLRPAVSAERRWSNVCFQREE